MPSANDLTGQRYNRWTVLYRLPNNKHGRAV